jgi:hypothetical protein
MSKHKRCKLLGKVAPLPPGTSLTVYGHKWIMEKDGNAYGDIHVDFHAVEIKSGRYVVVKDKPVSPDEIVLKPEPLQKDQLEHFSHDIGTYFAMGDLSKFSNAIRSLRNEMLREFSETRLDFILSEKMSKSDMITQIIKVVEVKNS